MTDLTNYPNGVTSFGVPLVGGGVPTVKGKYWWANSSSTSNKNDGKSKDTAFLTIQAAIDKAVDGDAILVAPGQYDETLLVDKSVTIVGLGGRGAAFVEPDTAGAEGMKVTANDVTLVNLGVAGESTSDYALNLNSAKRFRAYECKIEGPDDIIVLVDGTATSQTADALFKDCEFAWGGKAMIFDDSLYGYPTQIFVQECRFHNIVTHMFGVNPSGLVNDLHVTNSMFANQEDNTAPTDYILLSSNSNTGIFAGNTFATATNATGVLTIGTGIMWGPNGTEAGWSTARPA